MKNEYFIFEYLYRDASNYKAWGELLLAGYETDSDIEYVRRFMEAGEFFIPERLGIPELRSDLYHYSGGPTADDHAYHEFVDLRKATSGEIDSLSVWVR